ncbi:MAG: DUF169 domain-containing protein [Bacteroidales bacterium]|nr:DUF169 domain-containing protein [Bacteroidales bacterium]
MSIDCNYLMQTAGLEYPVIGLYDTPDASAFEPLVKPPEGKWACVFMFFNAWKKGESLRLTANNYGCGGAGTYLFCEQTRSRDNYIEFLHGEEGLKDTPELMGEWIDQSSPYKPEHENIVIGPLREDQEKYLNSVTFFINPDQLSLFVTAAHYYHGPNDPERVTAPFASGCGLMLSMLEASKQPKALIGATDIAMRKYLPNDILAFTVNKAMYEDFCRLDEDSFLDKPFWQSVLKSRKQK